MCVVDHIIVKFIFCLVSQSGDAGAYSSRPDSFGNFTAMKRYILCSPCIRKP